MLKKAGKIFGRIVLALLCLPIALLLLLFLLCPVINEIALGSYRGEVLKDLTLPESTEIVDTISGCGNSSGTGNHVELVVGVLVRSELETPQFQMLFPDSKLVEEQDFSTGAMRRLDLKLPEINEIAQNYYYLEFIESAPCPTMDLRGH